jgi:hypothetical protein
VGKERCPRHALEFARFHSGSILKGLHHSAQGCEPRATLGVRQVGANNPVQLCHLAAIQFVVVSDKWHNYQLRHLARRLMPNGAIERVASVVRGATCSRIMSRLERPGGDATLTGLGLLPVRLPRVARGCWAGRSNPFGIASWHAASRLPDFGLWALDFVLG